MASECLLCGGTGITYDGDPCPNCSGELLKKAMRTSHRGILIPMQYQGVEFDKSLLPEAMQSGYGSFMEDLLRNIYTDYSLYQKNILICSRPNSGKTIWSYSLINILYDKGFSMPDIQDLLTVREILNYKTGDAQMYDEIVNSRGLIVRLPSDMQFWMFDVIQTIIERRVSKNGFTIFLYNAGLERLKQADKNNTLANIVGTGSFHTIKVEDFTNERKDY